jgi:hypothetical protein
LKFSYDQLRSLYKEKHFIEEIHPTAPLYGLTTNIKLGWKGLPGTNTLPAYCEKYGRKFFIALGPETTITLFLESE